MAHIVTTAYAAVPSEDSTIDGNSGWFYFFQSVLNIISVGTALAYMFIVVCIFKHPSLQVITNYLLFSLGLATIMLQVICMVLVGTASSFCDSSCTDVHALFGFTLMAMCSVFYHSMLVAMETYLKICHPFRYLRVTSEKRYLAVIAIVWIGSIILGVSTMCYAASTDEYCKNSKCPIQHIFEKTRSFLITVVDICILPSLIVTVALKAVVIKTARIKAREIQAVEGNGRTNEKLPNDQQRDEKTLRKSTVNLIVFVVTYIIGWVPILIWVNLAIACRGCTLQTGPLILASISVVNLTSVGPLLYTLRQPEFARLRANYYQSARDNVRGFIQNHFPKVNCIRLTGRGDSNVDVESTT
ncbi:uncharacterized protein [Diadema antillarum]|uniref:uncharacterized protein n=1 Tax=Diadema antillarum TaxID=105358 RepID=UPI003A8BB888